MLITADCKIRYTSGEC